VAGLGIRLYSDEMISPRLAVVFRQHGYDAESCHEAQRARQKIPDEEQLEYATAHGRAVLTFNATDFYRLDIAWKAAGRAHYGIVLSVEVQDIGTLIRRAEHHLDTVSPAQQHDTIHWLPALP